MPLIVEYKNGQKEAIQGESYQDYDLMNRQGKIFARMIPHGREKIIYREDVRGIEIFPLAEWNKMVEDQKAAEEKKKEDEKKHRAEHEADARKRDEALRAAVDARRPISRVKRFLRVR